MWRVVSNPLEINKTYKKNTERESKHLPRGCVSVTSLRRNQLKAISIHFLGTIVSIYNSKISDNDITEIRRDMSATKLNALIELNVRTECSKAVSRKV